MEQVQITSDGIKRSLSRYNVDNAICEYIWNGFDAKANRIDIVYSINSMNLAVDLSIKDNGSGINKNDLINKFKPFFQSEKVFNPDETRTTSAVHGKNGVGRLTFFKFAKSASWDTVYEGIDGKKYKYSIEISQDSLEKYPTTEIKEVEKTSTGTEVVFKLIVPIYFKSIINYIKTEFCWFLELNKKKQYSIYINDEKLVYSDLKYNEESIGFSTSKNDEFSIDFVQWKEKLNNEYSRYYFINSKDEEINKDTTKLNNKGDKFYHSVYVRGDFFNYGFPKDKIYDGQLTIEQKRCRNDVLKELLDEINGYLSRKRKPFLKKYTDMLIEEYEKENVFPTFDNSIIGNYQKVELQNVVKELYQVEPKIFTNLNLTQKPTFIRLLNLILETGENDGLFNILSQIIELDDTERNDLAEILKVSKLSNITKTIKLIQDRYKAVNDLKELVFNRDIYVNEVYHIQKIIENHYWLFGEKYNLVTAAEPKFEEALRRYRFLLDGENKKRKLVSPDKNKEMDIFAVRVNMNSRTVNNIIVELKRPDVKLGEKEFNQVKRYLNVIKNEPEFNVTSANWDFILVGNEFDKSKYIQSELDNATNHGEKSLAFKSGNFKVYVKLWSEIIDEFECNHNFLNEKLKIERERIVALDRTADQIIEQTKKNTARQKPELVLVK